MLCSTSTHLVVAVELAVLDAHHLEHGKAHGVAAVAGAHAVPVQCSAAAGGISVRPAGGRALWRGRATREASASCKTGSEEGGERRGFI